LLQDLLVAAYEGTPVDEYSGRTVDSQSFSFRNIRFHSGFGFGSSHAGMNRVCGYAGGSGEAGDFVPDVVGGDGVLIIE